VRRLERIVTLYREDSDLTLLNGQGFLVMPPPEMGDIVRQSRAASELAGGAFDPTVQPLWELYRRHFSTPGASETGPASEAVADGLARVGPSDPLDSASILKVLYVEDRAVATSSPFGFRFDREGKFSHIIDPRSGATPQRHASVTVVTDKAALADALSTAFNLMDLEAIAASVRTQTDVEAHVLSLQGEWMTFTA
jgi:thiamine biosynthesis lipoprotein ApbE